MRRKPPSAAISKLRFLFRLGLEYLTVGVHDLQREPDRTEQLRDIADPRERSECVRRCRQCSAARFARSANSRWLRSAAARPPAGSDQPGNSFMRSALRVQRSARSWQRADVGYVGAVDSRVEYLRECFALPHIHNRPALLRIRCRAALLCTQQSCSVVT